MLTCCAWLQRAVAQQQRRLAATAGVPVQLAARLGATTPLLTSQGLTISGVCSHVLRPGRPAAYPHAPLVAAGSCNWLPKCASALPHRLAPTPPHSTPRSTCTSMSSCAAVGAAGCN